MHTNMFTYLYGCVCVCLKVCECTAALCTMSLTSTLATCRRCCSKSIASPPGPRVCERKVAGLDCRRLCEHSETLAQLKVPLVRSTHCIASLYWLPTHRHSSASCLRKAWAYVADGLPYVEHCAHYYFTEACVWTTKLQLVSCCAPAEDKSPSWFRNALGKRGWFLTGRIMISCRHSEYFK